MKSSLIVISLWISSTLPALAAAPIEKLSYKGLDGKSHTLAEYQGKTLLIVNTASHCGYTGQFKGLQSLYEKYKQKGLVILGFPSQSFGQEFQEAGAAAKFCQRNYGVKFPMASLVEVTGKNKHPLFQALLEGYQGPDKGEIAWNFEKFLVDRNGKVGQRFRSSVEPDSQELSSAIEQALK